MTTTAKFLAINIDCAEPKKLAEFYAAVFGYEVQYAEDTYAGIGDGTMTIYFQQNLDRKPAAWPRATSSSTWTPASPTWRPRSRST